MYNTFIVYRNYYETNESSTDSVQIATLRLSRIHHAHWPIIQKCIGKLQWSGKVSKHMVCVIDGLKYETKRHFQTLGLNFTVLNGEVCGLLK